MIVFVLGIVGVTGAVMAFVVAADAHTRIGDQEEDIERLRADVAGLHHQVLRVRRDRLPPINRLPRDWWEGDLDDLEQQIVKRAS